MFFHLYLYILFCRGVAIEVLLIFDYLDVSFFKLSFAILFDFYSFMFSSFILLISCVVLYYSLFYMDGEVNKIRFLRLVLLFIGSILLLVYLPSLLGIILGWDGLGVSSFLLVIFYNNVSSLRSGLLTIYLNRLGDVFFIFSYFFLFCIGFLSNDFVFCTIYILFYCFILLAGITKRAQIPFSSWLPAAISAPTPVSSLVHSSTLVTAGVYMFIRFFYLVRVFFLRSLLCIISLLTFFSAGLIACVEIDMKKLVAISTLSQLGLMMFSFFLGDFFLTFFHMVSHALFKSLLFLTCGFLIIVAFSSQDMRFIGGKFLIRKRVFFIILLSIMRLIGVFFLRGFFSKDLIVDVVFRVDLFLIRFFLFISSCLLSVFYRLKFMYESLLGFQMSLNENVGVSFKLARVFLGLLFFWSVFFGKSFFLFLFDGELISLVKWQKLVGGFLLLGGVFFLAILKRTLFHSLVNYVSEIFFLNWFFGGFFSSKLSSINVVLIAEAYWFEKLGALGINHFFLMGFKNLFLFKNFFLVCIIGVLFLIVFFTLLPFSL